MKIKLILSLLILCNSALASSSRVTITLPKPTWQFETKYGLLTHEAARLEPSEQQIAAKIKPLLAKANYQAAWQVVNTIDTKNTSAALAQAIGQIALQIKQLVHSEHAFKHAIAKRPDLIPSHRALAAIYLKQHDNKNAIKHLTKALTLGDQDPSLFAQLAYVHMQQSQPYAAIAGFRQALFLAPENRDYKKGLLWSLTQAGDVSEATTLLNQLIEETPNEAELWLHLSQIQLQQGQEANALTNLEVARRLGDNAPTNLLLNAQLHLNHGSSKTAVALLKQIIDHHEKTLLPQIISALPVLIQQKNIDDAQTLALTLKRNINTLDFKQHSTVLTYLGLLANRKGNTQQAKKYLMRAIEIDVTNGKALLQLGQLYQSEKQLSLADNYYVRASSLAEFREHAWLFSAQIAIDQGQYKRAISLLNNAYRENPTRRDLLANIKQLEQLKRVQ